MNEQPQKIWKKSWKGSSWLMAWLILIVVTMLIFVVVNQFLPNKAPVFGAVIAGSVIGAVVSTLMIGVWAFVRWLCCWKNLRRFLFVCACLATLIALAYAEEDWRSKHALQAFEQQWEAKGEKFDWQSIVPPAVPDDQNFALAPIWVESIKAKFGPINSRQFFGDNYAEDGRTNFVNRLDMPLAKGGDDWPTNGEWQEARLTDLKPWQDYYRKLAATTNLFPVSPQPQTPAQDVLLALSKYDPTIEELRADAAARPYSRFPLNYSQQPPASILLPHLSMLKSTSRLLALRAVAELQNGQSDKALDDIKLSFRLIDSIRTESFTISHLVRIAISQITLQPIYEGLAEHRWSNAQLSTLDRELANMNFFADYGTALRAERALSLVDLEYFRHTHNQQMFNYISDDSGNNARHPVQLFTLCLLPNAFFYQNELSIVRFETEWYLPIVDIQARTASPDKARTAESALKNEFKHTTPGNIMAKMLLPSFGGAAQRFAFGQESVDLARVAIALERYRLAMGTYPDSLDALSPHFLPGVPKDIINGQPLHYQRTSHGQFILYSVGWNETDDGGTVSLDHNGTVNRNLGDWVWRYPSP